MTAEQVGRLLGVDKTTICRHLHRLGVIRPGPPKRPLVSSEQIVQLRDQSLIWREIGAAVGSVRGQRPLPVLGREGSLTRFPGHLF